MRIPRLAALLLALLLFACGCEAAPAIALQIQNTASPATPLPSPSPEPPPTPSPSPSPDMTSEAFDRIINKAVACIPTKYVQSDYFDLQLSQTESGYLLYVQLDAASPDKEEARRIVQALDGLFEVTLAGERADVQYLISDVGAPLFLITKKYGDERFTMAHGGSITEFTKTDAALDDAAVIEASSASEANVKSPDVSSPPANLEKAKEILASPRAEKSEAVSAASNSLDASSAVYTTKSGKRYHIDPKCSNMKSPIAMTLSEAEAKGRTPCKKCVPES